MFQSNQVIYFAIVSKNFANLISLSAYKTEKKKKIMSRGDLQR